MSEAEATSHLIVDSSASGVEALRESHELLALATEAAQAGWVTWDLQTGESDWDERGKQIIPPNVECSLSVEGDEALVPPEIRSQPFLILREAVRNAVTHSEAAHISVEVDIARGRVAGRVEDDGRGFDPDEARTGGLRAMSERATLVGGTLDLSSAPGRGTKIKVSVPLGDA